MTEARELTERYGETTAVHSLSSTIAHGTVRRRQPTTVRMIMGLDRPTSGTVTVNGKPYRRHRASLREGGALLIWESIGGAGGARTHDPGIMSDHALCAVLTGIDAARAEASVVEYSGAAWASRPLRGSSGVTGVAHR